MGRKPYTTKIGTANIYYLQKLSPLRGRKQSFLRMIISCLFGLQKLTPVRGLKPFKPYLHWSSYLVSKPYPRLEYIPFPTLKFKY